ncbi:MAG TPA: hypothetical protein VEK08_09645 [Planctomycetota bacterium]|nr:hypothetical protein [Planctomycetota bacterium]
MRRNFVAAGSAVVLFSLVCCWKSFAGETRTMQFNVPLGGACLNGDLSITVQSGNTPVQGMLSLQFDTKGALTGSLTLGADVFTVKGKQSFSKGSQSLSLSGVSASGAKVRLSGRMNAGVISGTFSGSGSAAGRGTFSLDASRSGPLVAKVVVNLTDNDKGSLSGSGTATICGVSEPITAKGKVTPGTDEKAAQASLSLKGKLFNWSGKGPVLEAGYLFTWKGKGNAVTASGENLALRIAPPDGPSAGSIVISSPAPTSFLPTPATLVLQVVGAQPSINADEFSFTLNGEPYSAAVLIDAAQGTVTFANVPLKDGPNTLAISGKDSFGLNLSGTLTLWAGTHSMTVGVVNEKDEVVANATVTASLGDDQSVTLSAVTNADGIVTLSPLPDRTIILKAQLNNAFGVNAHVGSAAFGFVVLRSIGEPSPIDNNDFATGDASGWNVGSAPITITAHNEAGGGAEVREAVDLGDYDMIIPTSGPGAQTVSRTFTTKPNTVAVRVRYRFITSEVPGGYFGTKWNDFFAISIVSQQGGGVVSEANTMNGLGLAAFDASGATAWREAILPVNASGDLIFVDATVANIGDDLFDSALVIDKIQEITIDLTVAKNDVKLLETNRFEIRVEPPGAGSNFVVEVRYATRLTWQLLGNGQVIDGYVHRVAGRFEVRGKANLGGVEQVTPVKTFTVNFPTYVDITTNPGVRAKLDAAWQSVLAAANPNTRREEGFFVLLNTNPGVSDYQFSSTLYGPLVTDLQTGWMVLAPKPDDNPSPPEANASGIYVVADFHAHTPTFYRTLGREVGPSNPDFPHNNSFGIPGIVYDYVGQNGFVPAKWPLNSPARLFLSGPIQRPTP